MRVSTSWTLGRNPEAVSPPDRLPPEFLDARIGTGSVTDARLESVRLVTALDSRGLRLSPKCLDGAREVRRSLESERTDVGLADTCQGTGASAAPERPVTGGARCGVCALMCAAISVG